MRLCGVPVASTAHSPDLLFVLCVTIIIKQVAVLTLPHLMHLRHSIKSVILDYSHFNVLKMCLCDLLGLYLTE